MVLQGYQIKVFLMKWRLVVFLFLFLFAVKVILLQYIYTTEVQSNCQEKHNFVFIKCMKTAGTTMLGLFRRFGVSRNLSIVTPIKNNIYLNWPFPLTNKDYRPSLRGYNILIDHAVFAEKEMSELMPTDTVYISSIRHPLAHLKSTFAYFKIHLTVGIPDTVENPVITYFSDPEKYDVKYMEKPGTCIPKGVSLTKNLMSKCLGVPLGDEQAIHKYFEYLEKKFSLIMIVEYFDESLILLKRLMCWKFSDIVYVSMNVLNYNYKRTKLPDHIEDTHRRWDWIDYKLYDYFNASLWRRINAQSSDFHDEVKAFKAAQERANQYCWAIANLKDQNNGIPVYLNETKFAGSEWSEEFSITSKDCFYLSEPYSHLHNLQIMSDKNDADLIGKQKQNNDTRPLHFKGLC